MTTISFIGLGNMGNPMAAHLVKAGHKVQGFDLIPENLAVAQAGGVTRMRDAVASLEGAEVVISMLPAGKHVLSVYEEIAPWVAKGALLIDSSTIDVESARITAERLRRCVAEAPYRHSQGDYPITTSIGHATAHNQESLEQLLQRADTALYRAKREGRNRVEQA